jgi:hypothetical protein
MSDTVYSVGNVEAEFVPPGISQAAPALLSYMASRGVHWTALGKVSLFTDLCGSGVEGLSEPYRCIWRAYSPDGNATGHSHWNIRIWMLPERRAGQSRAAGTDELALRAMAALYPPYRCVSLPFCPGRHPGETDQPESNFEYELWTALDTARSFRRMEALLGDVPGVEDVRLEGYQRNPVDEIVWLKGSLSGKPFTYIQNPGSSPMATLELKQESSAAEPLRVSTPVSRGWYGDDVLVRTFAALLEDIAPEDGACAS